MCKARAVGRLREDRQCEGKASPHDHEEGACSGSACPPRSASLHAWADPNGPPFLHHFGHAEVHPHHGHWKQISRSPWVSCPSCSWLRLALEKASWNGGRSHTLTLGRLGCRATMRLDGWCEQGVACLRWQLAWLETVVINSAELHARREEREEHQGR